MFDKNSLLAMAESPDTANLELLQQIAPNDFFLDSFNAEEIVSFVDTKLEFVVNLWVDKHSLELIWHQANTDAKAIGYCIKKSNDVYFPKFLKNSEMQKNFWKYTSGIERGEEDL
jgi:hypothetical protein